MISDETASILHRRIVDMEPRTTQWITAAGWAGHPLADILARTSARQLYLVGGWDRGPRPSRAFWRSPAAEGWAVSRFNADPASARYTRGTRTVDVRTTAAWFGDCDDAELCRQAWIELTKAIRGCSWEWRGANLMGTPARTGLDLLQRVLPVQKDERGHPLTDARGRQMPYEYSPLAEDLQQIIRHNLGQGRMECVAPEGMTAETLHVMDARWMYAACVRHLPVGPVVHDEDPDFERGRPGFYHISFVAPSDWPYPFGLLHVLGEGWPTGRAAFDTWTTEPELRLARDAGWTTWIHERILFAPDGPGTDPARQWQSLLVNLRARLQQLDPRREPWAPLAVRAVRNLLVNAVGSFYRDERLEWAWQPVNPLNRMEIPLTPAEATPARAQPDLAHVQYWEWQQPAPLARDLLPFVRPEWSAMVWGRARARVAQAAMRYCDEHPGDLAWFRSDALAVRTHPYWPDGGKIGTFRGKPPALRIGGGPVPRTDGEYEALLAANRAEE